MSWSDYNALARKLELALLKKAEAEQREVDLRAAIDAAVAELVAWKTAGDFCAGYPNRALSLLRAAQKAAT